MCVDYRDLNRASPKDNFPLPHIDTLVDNTTKHFLFSFMDRFSGYNQIRMASEDMEKTTVDAPFGPDYFYFNVRWTLGPFMSRFEFGPRTYFVMWFIYFYQVFESFRIK